MTALLAAVSSQVNCYFHRSIWTWSQVSPSSVPSWLLPADFIHFIQSRQGAQQRTEAFIRFLMFWLDYRENITYVVMQVYIMTGQDIPLVSVWRKLCWVSSSLLRLTSPVLTSSMTVWGNNCDSHTFPPFQMNPRTSIPPLIVLPSMLITFILVISAAATGIVLLRFRSGSRQKI